MDFGFDIDGTITAAPEQFRAIMTSLQLAGHRVHVITGQPTEPTAEDCARRSAQLHSLGLPSDCYDELYVAGPDYVRDKMDYCRNNKIAFMFEDSTIYAEAISAVCPVVVMYDRL